MQPGAVTGVDLSPGMIAKAQQMTVLEIPTTFITTDFLNWEPGERQFDKIFSMEAFYYFSDVPAAIRKATQLLQPGGTFACIVDYYTENVASADWPSPQQCAVRMQRYAMAEWVRMFQDAGLRQAQQRQIRLPVALATHPWEHEVGSLVTIGTT